MKKEIREQLLKEAVRIGDEILALAENDKNGMSWNTMSVDNNIKKVFWGKSATIYSGVCGIVLFYLALHRITKKEIYLNAAIEGMRWVEHYCQNNPTEFYAFFTGRLGVAYCFLKMAEATQNNDYLEKALSIVRTQNNSLVSSRVDDLINGTAGKLLGLLHLHSATNDKKILNTINMLVERLIRGAHHCPSGFYWDRSGDNTRGLCSFSHGAAGVGYVFLELGRYFQNDAFYWIAEQAFAYESNFYDPSIMNWPDFRKGIFEIKEYEEHRKEYLDGNIDFFLETTQMIAWCHGAPGIGLSRLRAFELLKKPVYKTEAEFAIKRTAETITKYSRPLQSFTLCHGGCGNAELLLEAYKLFKNDEYLFSAETMAIKALESKKKNHNYQSGYAYAGKTEDISLFMGNAGIGYFYLKLLEPSQVPSVLAPGIDMMKINKEDISNFPFINITKDKIQRVVLEKLFPRTLCAMEHIASDRMDNSLIAPDAENRDMIKAPFIGFAKRIFNTFTDTEQERMVDLFDLELEKIKVDEVVQSNAWLYIKDMVKAEHAEKQADLETKFFLNIKLKLEPDIKIKIASWNWNQTTPERWEKNINMEAEEWPVLFKPKAEGVMEKSLTPFLHTLLSIFKKEKRVKSAIDELIKEFDEISIEDRKEIEKTAIQQIKQALLAGILVSKV